MCNYRWWLITDESWLLQCNAAPPINYSWLKKTVSSILKISKIKSSLSHSFQSDFTAWLTGHATCFNGIRVEGKNDKSICFFLEWIKFNTTKKQYLSVLVLQNWISLRLVFDSIISSFFIGPSSSDWPNLLANKILENLKSFNFHLFQLNLGPMLIIRICDC